MDPTTTAKSFALLNEARKAGFAAFRRWRNADSFKRLARLLRDHFEGDPFLAGQDWEFLRTKADVVELLDAFFVDQTPLRPELPATLHTYLDPVSDAAPLVDDLAEQVTKAIEDLAPKIWESETDRVVYVIRAELAEQLEVSRRTRANTETLLEHAEAIRETLEVKEPGRLDALPDDIRPYFERLLAEDANAARRLVGILLAASSIKAGADGLILASPGWIAEVETPGLVWAVLGRVAAHYGSWEEAETAYLRADEAGYDRRANALARASEAADALGKSEEARSLLERAEALDRRDATVAIRAALLFDDPEEQLARLDEADPRADDERAAIEANRATALLAKGAIEEAHTAASRAIELNSRFVYAKIVLAWAKNRRGAAAAPSGNQDVEDLRAAATILLSAREALASSGRHSEALALVSDIGHSYILAHEQLRAVSLLEEVVEDVESLSQASPEARTAAAETAMTLQRPDLAERLLPEESNSDEARLLRATLKVTSSADAAGTAEAAEMLDDLISTSSDEIIRAQAALMRLAASTKNHGVEWSGAAEEVLRAGGNAEAADGLRAQYLSRIGQAREAETILLQSDNPRMRELLVHSALESGDIRLAIQRSEALVRQFPSPARSLELAELLILDGRADEADSTLAAFRRDDRVPLDVRDRAYFLSVREAYKARRYDETEQLTAEWLELVPSETDAAWVRLESLLWLSRYEEALSLIDSATLDPDEIGKGRMLAHIYLRALPPAEALAKIAAISDRFDRGDDRLEGLVVVCYANASDDLAEDLAIRGRQALEEFPARFPDSKANARAVSLEDLKEILKQRSEQGAALDKLTSDIFAGQLPVAVLAIAERQSLTALWSKLRVQPIAFNEPTILVTEADVAERAIGVGAVWDPTSLVITGLLAEATTTIIEQALPRSIQVHATLQDVDYAAIDAAEGRTGAEQTLAFDDELQQPVLLVRDPADVALERQRVRAILERARQLEVIPDVDTAHQTQFDSAIPDIIDIESMITAVTYGSLAAASRVGLPLYSDDRVIRGFARGYGIPAFGTPSLLDALTSRGLLTKEDYDQARASLMAAGAIDLGA